MFLSNVRWRRQFDTFLHFGRFRRYLENKNESNDVLYWKWKLLSSLRLGGKLACDGRLVRRQQAGEVYCKQLFSERWR